MLRIKEQETRLTLQEHDDDDDDDDDDDKVNFNETVTFFDNEINFLCIVKPYGILQAKYASVSFVYCVVAYTVCSLRIRVVPR